MSGFGDFMQENTGTIASIAGGAVGSLLGPGGTVAGAGIGGEIAGLLGGGASGDGSSAEFRDFIRATGAGAWEDTLKASGDPVRGGTKTDFLPSFYRWLVDSGKSIGWWTTNGNPMTGPAYVPGFTEPTFAQMGIDYAASAANYRSGNSFGVVDGKWGGWVYTNGSNKSGGAGVKSLTGGMPWEEGAVKNWSLVNWAVWLFIGWGVYRLAKWAFGGSGRRRKKRRATL